MRPEPGSGWPDRLAPGLLGGLAGAAYGGLIALLFYLLGGNWQAPIVAWSALVFAGLGYVRGNLIVEALLALLHFLWGLGCALAERPPPRQPDGPRDPLEHFLLLGFGTGLVLLLSVWV